MGMAGGYRCEGCRLCSQQGWIEYEIEGVRRAVRCSCFAAHQEKLARLGVGGGTLALPAGVAEE